MPKNGRDHLPVCPGGEIPFIAKQTRIVPESCGKFDAESLDEYLAAGGFAALKKAMFDMTRSEVIDQVGRSGLRGRCFASCSEEPRDGTVIYTHTEKLLHDHHE